MQQKGLTLFQTNTFENTEKIAKETNHLQAYCDKNIAVEHNSLHYQSRTK